jgi:hypothetical protein
VNSLPFDLSVTRVTRIAVALGALGVVIAGLTLGPRDGLGFLIGSILSVITVRSWFKLAHSLGADGSVPGAGAATFLVVRYLLIAGAVYATIKVLRSSPMALILGLLVSFAAVVVELMLAMKTPKLPGN